VPTIHELHKKLVNKEISAVELTNAVIAHKAKVEPTVHAYLSDSHDRALTIAKVVDEAIAKGEAISPLAGIPGAIKDNICIKDEPATCASKMLENFVPPYNASVIERLQDNHYISLGKLNMDEFAMGGSTENSALAKTTNPWNIDCVPGGSSGGSAAAVSSGSAIWALGSDTGGSIRQPASFCGVVGLKPTYGNVSRYGLIAFASSLDQIGPVTRDVTDAALVLNAISGYDAKDSTSIPGARVDYTTALVNDVKNLKIGVPKEFFGEGLNSEVRKAMEEAIKEQATLYKLPKNETSRFEQKRSHAISIDQPVPVGSGNNFTLQHILENENSKHADEHLNQEILSNEIQKGLDILDDREKRVITYIYGLAGAHYTMAEIAEDMGLKRERVRQIRDKALRKLHKKMK